MRQTGFGPRYEVEGEISAPDGRRQRVRTVFDEKWTSQDAHRAHREVDRILSIAHLSPMQTISYTDARNQLASLIEMTARDREPITITRNGAGTAVLLSAEEYAAMEATLHLLSTPANAERIRKGLADYAAGKLKARKLCD